MGIKGIKALIKKHCPDAITEISIEALKGKTICIDSSILLYKYRYTYTSDNFHILGFLHKINEFHTYGIKPIFVFDGKPPDAKRETLNKRREKNTKLKEQLQSLKEKMVTPEFIHTDSDSDTEESDRKEINKKISILEKNIKTVNKTHSQEVIELLKNIGISFFESPSEAEQSCVFLQTNGDADYILTEDTDSLTFGGTKILFTNKNTYFLCSLDKVLEGFQLNHDEFIDLCILCGCDYTTTIPKVGPVTALQIIKEHRSIENFIKNNTKYTIPEEFDYITAQKIFKTKEKVVLHNCPTENKKIFSETLSKWNIQEKYSNYKFNFI
jgi:flap endonuclease-1